MVSFFPFFVSNLFFVLLFVCCSLVIQSARKKDAEDEDGNDAIQDDSQGELDADEVLNLLLDDDEQAGTQGNQSTKIESVMLFAAISHC